MSVTPRDNEIAAGREVSERAPGRRRPKMVAGLIVVAAFMLTALFADFLAPYDYREQSLRSPMAPATKLHFRNSVGAFSARPYVAPLRMIDPLERTYEEDAAKSFPVRFFVRGYRYRLFGFIPCERHLFGLEVPSGEQPTRVNLLGTDALGRDRWSRVLIATRFSLLVGPVGALLASLLGLLLGAAASGGGRGVDAVLMRAADAMMAAAKPVDPNAGILERLLESAESVVKVRPVGSVAGDDPGARIARMEVALKAGDLEKAMAEYDGLPDAVKQSGAAFAERVKARIEVTKLVDQLVAGAMKAA